MFAASSNPVTGEQQSTGLEKGISNLKTRRGNTLVAIKLRKGEVGEIINTGLCIAGIKKKTFIPRTEGQ